MMTFEHQISGHSNTISISNSNSSSIIKLTNLIELNFYSITSKLLTNQPFIGTWIPTFWGTLSHQHDDDKKKIMLVLENLTFPFLKPNILDVKLGNELFDVNASLQKQMKLTNLSKETTSSSNSLRISAFKVWNSSTSTYSSTDKLFGKLIKSNQLSQATSHFFPGSSFTKSSSSSSSSLPPFISQSTTTTTTTTTTATTTSATPLTTPMINLESLSISSASPPPLPIDLLIPLLRSILYRLNELLELLGTLEWTCRSGSVLLIYEGDVDALRAAFERTGTREGDERRSFTPTPDSPPRSYSIGDSKEVDHKHTSGRNDSDQVKEEQEDEEEEDENETSDEDSTTSSGSPHPNSMRVFDIRLIDFAHTTSQGKGSGIDHGLVQGVHSLIDIVAELLRETEAVSV